MEESNEKLNLKKIVAQKLKELGKTIPDTSLELGLKRDTLTKILQRNSTSRETIERISDLLDIPLENIERFVGKENIVKRTKSKYIVQQVSGSINNSTINENKILKDEVDFLRKHVNTLTSLFESALKK